MPEIHLVDFFKYYDELPHQMEAVQMLQQAMPSSLLKNDSAWVEHYRTPPPIQEKLLDVPYFSQLDNLSGEGERECFSSSCAMAAAYWGKVISDDAYNSVRAQYGDTTDPYAQMKALRSFGLTAQFVADASVEQLRQEISLGRPTPVGWLHKGHVDNPSGSGHWSCVIGHDDNGLIHHDPNGEADLVAGGYTQNLNGTALHYSNQNWDPRWLVEGPKTGWMMRIFDPT